MTIHPKETIDFDAATDGEYSLGAMIQIGLANLQKHCHAASYNRGWWCDPVTGLSLVPGDDRNTEGMDRAERIQLSAYKSIWFPYVVATKIALIHSEVSEMLEAHRTDAQDDKIDFPGITAEAADVVIRICDLLGMLEDTDAPSPRGGQQDYDLGLAILAKIPFNATRADHALEKRAQPGQKKY